MQQKRNQQAEIRLGSHGEDYGSWMSNPVFYIIGGITALAVVLAALSFSVFHITVLGVLFSVAAAALAALLVWIAWIRRQYAFGGGGIMEQVHRVVLSHLDYDGQGSLLEVGCGSGALSIRAALTWPETRSLAWTTGELFTITARLSVRKNAASEGVASRCVFRMATPIIWISPMRGFDAVISNYVYHNIMGADMHKLLLESLRVLKKGGVFALNDDMKPRLYGDMDAFAQKLREMGYQDVRLIDTAEEAFGSHRRACHDDAGLFPAACGQKVIRPNRRVDHVQVGCCRGHAVCPHAGQDLCQRVLPADPVRSQGAGTEKEIAFQPAGAGRTEPVYPAGLRRPVPPIWIGLSGRFWSTGRTV